MDVESRCSRWQCPLPTLNAANKGFFKVKSIMDNSFIVSFRSWRSMMFSLFSILILMKIMVSGGCQGFCTMLWITFGWIVLKFDLSKFKTVKKYVIKKSRSTPSTSLSACLECLLPSVGGKMDFFWPTVI